jgi:hypothetical protein
VMLVPMQPAVADQDADTARTNTSIKHVVVIFQGSSD